MPEDGKLTVTAVVPVWNEEVLLAPSVRRIDSVMRPLFEEYEILIIESGSTDGTGEICDSLASEMSRVRVVHEGARNGFGSVLRLGYELARMEFVWVVPVDFPFRPEEMVRAVPLLGGHDAVLSVRVSDPRPWYRRVQSVVYNRLVRFCMGIKARQVNSAFKVVRRGLLQGVGFYSRGWFFDAELLYWLQRRQARITELPVDFPDREEGRSTVTASSWIGVLKEMGGFVWHVRVLGQRPQPKD